MKIDKTEILYIQKRRRDDVGDVFDYQGKLLRGIFPDKVEMVREMFENGFIKELIDEDLFPNTWITNYEIDRYGLIIEHEKIEPIVYPQEWTFNMLKDSALTVLKVAKIAKKYGYNMKDCHGFNILIDKQKPKFIDLGSFHVNKKGVTGWEPYQEFLRFYYYPLYTWAKGLNYTSKLSIFSANLTPHIEHYLFKSKILRYLPENFIDKFVKLNLLLPTIACWDYDRIKKISDNKIKVLVKSLKKVIDKTNFTISQNLVKLERKIEKLNKRSSHTHWANYHDKISKKEMRFNKIITLINKYCSDAISAIDIGGNQGKFSEKLLKETSIKKVICQDLDEDAIDKGYKRNQKIKLNISYVNYNFMSPIVKTTHPMPWERFRSDIVIALALLHHLILTQGFSLDDILKELKKYTKKYICVEFMPRGLWTYDMGENYNVPNWYTIDWFKISFEKHFSIIHNEQIEANYIVFIGEIKNGEN